MDHKTYGNLLAYEHLLMSDEIFLEHSLLTSSAQVDAARGFPLQKNNGSSSPRKDLNANRFFLVHPLGR